MKCDDKLITRSGPAHRRRRRVTLRKETRAERETGISLLGLTPGTPFMARVADSLAFYACQRLQQSNYQGVAFEISGGTVPVSQLSATPVYVRTGAR
jgi:5'-3' exonuclease